MMVFESNPGICSTAEFGYAIAMDLVFGSYFPSIPKRAWPPIRVVSARVRPILEKDDCNTEGAFSGRELLKTTNFCIRAK